MAFTDPYAGPSLQGGAPWTDAYIDVPFRADGRDRSGLDCWGLVYLVYRERLGVELPRYPGVFTDQSEATLRRIAALMDEERRRYVEVSVPQEYDLVLMRKGELHGHVGLFVPRHDVLHIYAGVNSTRHSLNSIHWRNRIVGYFRHVG